MRIIIIAGGKQTLLNNHLTVFKPGNMLSGKINPFGRGGHHGRFSFSCLKIIGHSFSMETTLLVCKNGWL